MTPRTLRTIAAGGCLAVVTTVLGIWAIGGAQMAAPRFAGAGDLPPATASKLGPVTAYGGMTERPVFTPTRRPAAPPSLAAADPGQDSAPVSGIVAVAVGPDRKAAILKLRSGGTAVLMQGEAIEGWVLSEISPSGAVLRNGASQTTLTLRAPAGEPRP